MRISNLLLNNINNQEKALKIGSVLKAKILEITEEFILIDIKGHGITKAVLESDLGALKGEEIPVVVKSIVDNKIELKMNNGELKEGLSNYVNKDNSISLLLKNFNIRETDSSVLLVESLMDYKVPINEESLNESIKTLDKIIQLTNLNEEDKVILLTEPISEDKDISKLNKTLKKLVPEPSNENIKINKQNILEANITLDKSILPEKSNIKNLLIVGKNDHLEKDDISSLVKEFLGNNIENKEEIIKLVSFLIKNDIEPSLNNIKNLKELNEDPVEFSKSFEKVMLLVDSLENSKKTKPSTPIESNINFTKEDIEKNSAKVEDLKNIIDNFKDSTKLNLKENIKSLENKIDFLKDMNKNLSFLFLPINFGKKDLEGALTILKGNKKKNPSDNKTNVFINLNTDNLGNIKISCEAISNLLSVKINIKKEDLNLFQSIEEKLIERISSIGYKIENINFISDKDIQIIDSMASNSNPTYFLDIKV